MGRLDETNFESCTKCTICTEYCPVSEVNPDFPGPKRGGPDGTRLRLKDPGYYDDALKYCTNCKRCEVACPSGVHIGDIIQLARNTYDKQPGRLRDYVLSRTDLMGRLSANPGAILLNRLTRLGVFRKVFGFLTGITSKRTLPVYGHHTFRYWFSKNARTNQKQFQDQVVLFHGCYVNYNNPSLGQDIVTVLNAFGVGVQLLEGEVCCGAPLIAARAVEKATRNAQTNSQIINRAVGERGLRVVVPSSTCTLALRNEYPDILDVDNSPWRDRVDLLTRYFYRLSEAGRTVTLTPLPLRVVYHTPCHMERLGWASYSIELLKRIPGLELTILPSRCCGIAGTYGYKVENYETSQKIGAPLFRLIEESGADVVACDCETCKFQIDMSTSRKCVHPVTLFAWALQGGGDMEKVKSPG